MKRMKKRTSIIFHGITYEYETYQIVKKYIIPPLNMFPYILKEDSPK